MTYYWSSILSVFLPATLLLAAHWCRRPAGGLWAMVLSSLGALLLGVVLGHFFPLGQKAALAFSAVYLGALVLFVLWQFTRIREWFWHMALIALAGAVWGRTPVVLSLTGTHVINTALLLNLASVTTALAMCMLLAWLLCLMLREIPLWRWALLLGVALVAATPLAGQVVLSLMKLQVMELSKGNLSFAAKTTNLEVFIPYILLGLTGVVLLAAAMLVVWPRRRAWHAQQELIARRIACAAYRRARAVLLGALLIVVCMLGCKLYYDLVASRPPALSESIRVEMRDDDTVRLPVTPLVDGNLHRFAWVADDGRLVRFFIINRLDDRPAPAVVFDACLLCGDKGYVQQGDQVVCVGCGVYMFKPSIGKPGGCNPVPVERWEVVDGEIVIPKTALEAGLQLFSTVLTIEVSDPVSGKKLTNTTAPYRYNYANKTFFFADEASFRAFRDDPQRYLPPPRGQEAADEDASGQDEAPAAAPQPPHEGGTP